MMLFAMFIFLFVLFLCFIIGYIILNIRKAKPLIHKIGKEYKSWKPKEVNVVNNYHVERNEHTHTKEKTIIIQDKK